VLNGIFVAIVLISILLAAYSGQMQALTDAILQDSRKAVELAIGLIGVMAFFLGLMGVAMILNISSNMLGLANAATPFGIKAMEELDKLNSRKGTATNSMILFLAINTAGLAVLPSGVIGLRAALDSSDAAGIFFPTWFASGTATVVGVSIAFLLSRLPRYRTTEPPALTPQKPETVQTDVPDTEGENADDEVTLRKPRWAAAGAILFGAVFLVLLARHFWISFGAEPTGDLVRSVLSYWMLPILVGSLILFGWARGVKVFESLVEGAKEGFQVALRIIPFLVAILVAVGMLRASGGIDLIVAVPGPVTELIRMPAEALPMAILRPLSGSGAYGVMAEIMSVHGPDSFIGYMVSTFQGSTETTLYVIAVYFGAVGVKRTRHALPACLAADVAGILAAVLIVNVMFG
jgi:spore maturation protein SpmB